MEIFLDAFIVMILSIFLIRLAGRKSLGQMTVAEAVIMISIGSAFVHPIAYRSITKTFVGATIMILLLIAIEYCSLKSKKIQHIVAGHSKLVIKDGKPLRENMKKMRISLEDLEMQLRQQSISRIEDVKMATMEVNGALACELKRKAQPLTVGEFESLMQGFIFPPLPNQPTDKNLFQKVEKKETQ